VYLLTVLYLGFKYMPVTEEVTEEFVIAVLAGTATAANGSILRLFFISG